MKNIIITAFAVSISISAAAFHNPDSLGLPGDGLNLQATLNLFKESKSPEEFEKKLNNKDNHVNNLDLNKDGDVDYIRVHDISQDNVHVIVLQVPVNAKESHDVAVIEIEKRGTESAAIQIVGDVELYGADYIVQPKPEKEKSGDDKFKHFSNNQMMFVNVWYWPCVNYMYMPGYAVWISPWYWSYYPMWWNPWAPYPYYAYYGWTYGYYDYYYCCSPVYVLPNAHEVYQPRRVVSQTVVQNNQDARNNGSTKPNQNVGTPTPQEAPRDPSRPSPQQNPTPAPTQQRGGDVIPAPQPVPQPSPRPQPRPDVRPQPSPMPTPAPRPMPAPRPTPRPR